MLGSRTVSHATSKAIRRWQSTVTGSAGPSNSRSSSSWRLSRRLIYPVLLTSAVSSLAINLRNARDELRVLEDQHRAQMSVLRDLVKRLEAGERVATVQIQKEYERVGLAKRTTEHHLDSSQSITWKEMLLGRRNQADLESERRELEEFEKALARVDDPTTSVPGAANVDSGKVVTSKAGQQDPPVSAPVFAQKSETVQKSPQSSKQGGIFI